MATRFLRSNDIGRLAPQSKESLGRLEWQRNFGKVAREIAQVQGGMKRLQNAAESGAKGFGSRGRPNFKPPAAGNSLALPTLVCYKPLNFFADVAIDRLVDSGFM